MTDTLGLLLFVLAVLLVLGWFAVGTIWNVRKGDATLKWLRQGLPLLGAKTTFRWLGSSAIELKIADAKPPFRNAETMVVYEPRDISVIWAISRLQGRRDLLILRLQLRTLPRVEFDIFNPRGWSVRDAESAAQKHGWTRVELPGIPSLVAYAAGDSSAAAKRLLAAATRAGGTPVRLAIRRRAPHLEIHWRLPEAQRHPPRDLFSQVREIGEEAMKA